MISVRNPFAALVRLTVLGIAAFVALVALASPAFAAGTAWSVSALPNSPTTSPTTSFTQGDGLAAFPGTGPDTLTLTVSNTGDTASSGTVTVTAQLGSGMSFVSDSAPNWSCSGTSTVTCTRSDSLAAGQSYPDQIVITVTVSTTAGVNTQGGGVPAHVNLNLTASGGGAAGSFAQTDPIPIVGRPNLISVDDVNTTFRQGDPNDSYTVNVINQGLGVTNSGTGTPAPAPIVATETIPAGETAVALSGSGWTCSLAATTAGVNGAVYTLPANSCWRTDSWPSFASLPPITVVVSVASNATTPENLGTTVSGGGSVTATNTVNVSTTIQQAADLTQTVTHTGTFDQGDSSGDTYTLTTKDVIGPNSTVGGATVGTVVVTDSAPAGETITRLSGTGWVCTLAGTQLTGTPNVVVPADSCYRSDVLAVGSTYPAITANVAVADDAQPGANSAVVSGGGMTTASMANGDQTATDAITVGQEPDLTTATSTSGPFTQGDTAASDDTFAITAQNVGFATTSGQVTLQDSLPNDLTPVSASGSGWNCTVTGQTVSCTRSDALAAASSYPAVTIAVTIATDAGTSEVSQIEVSGGSEIEPGNDYDAQQAYVAPKPDLTIGMTDSGNFNQNDQGDTYTLLVWNADLAPSTSGATVVDTLPAGMTATAIGGTGWSCELTTLTCTRSDTLPASGFYQPITLTVNVADDAPTPLTNSATVAGGGEIYSADDTATDVTGVTPKPTLSVSLAGTGSGTVTGSGINCPGTCSAAYDQGTVVTLTASAASGSTFTGWGGACSGTGSCQVTMSQSQSVTATFTVVPPPPPPTHTLTVSLAGSGRGSVSGGGINCPGTCSATYSDGTQVTLTASPASGTTFAGWTGACSGTGICTVTMSSDLAVTATFTKNPPPPPAPKCTLTALSDKVLLAKPKGRRPQPGVGQLVLAVKCNQAAKTTLNGVVTERIAQRHGKTIVKQVQLSAVHASVKANVRDQLTITLPASALSALKNGANESVAFTLTAVNANGTARATTSISRLHGTL